MSGKTPSRRPRKGYTKENGTEVSPTSAIVYVNAEQIESETQKARDVAEAIRSGKISTENDPTLGTFSDTQHPMVSTSAQVSESASLAGGTVVMSNASIGTEVVVGEGTTVGENVKLDMGSFIGSHVDLGNETTVGIGAHVGDRTIIENNTVVMPRIQQDGNMMPTETYVANDLTIGHHSFIGEGSKVFRSLPPYSVVKSQAIVTTVNKIGDGWTMNPKQPGTQKEREEYRTAYTIEVIKSSKKLITEQEQKILNERYGINDGQMKSVEEVAKTQNMSPSDIRKTEITALNKLREANPKLEKVHSVAWLRGDT